ncbi:hypothetical protein FHR99_001832 [Litorivivens lipolytica]|uniref:Glycosyl transferase family 28 C-terminal domain-containing protein n=1 Tax=Litorivivens lipolytica TaxID=1524264 RepID=A0A7W4Z753_9GAMM|nr:hypothetical protein [Litorivivens lipolytica]MBB3047566.1 hypothetical protein [Litorivivens lipolytica]
MLRPIVIAISAHGFGHLGQCVPVVRAIQRRFPGRRVVVISEIMPDVLRDFLGEEVELCDAPAQVSILMKDALRVDLAATRKAFLDWHSDYDEHRKRYASILREINPELLLSNVDHTPISAARSLGIPAFAMCSLNWADILDALYSDETEDSAMSAVCEEIREVYNNAEAFLRVTPGMGMKKLDNLHQVDVLAREGERFDLHRRLGVPDDHRFVLLSLGGITQTLDLNRWVLPEKTHWVVPDSAKITEGEANITPFGQLNMKFIDVLASVDILLTKPGYGSFCEAWRNQTSVLYVRRPRWAEEAALIDWIQRHTPSQEVSLEDFENGNINAAMSALLQRPATFSSLPCGETEVVNHLSTCLV